MPKPLFDPPDPDRVHEVTRGLLNVEIANPLRATAESQDYAKALRALARLEDRIGQTDWQDYGPSGWAL